MGMPGYLRFPHVTGDLVTFVADDDVWLAPVTGGRAWRVSADQVGVTDPRISPDGTRLAWTSQRDGAPEAHVMPIDGGPVTRLTYWGSSQSSVRGWLNDDEVLAFSAAGRIGRWVAWMYAVPVTGGQPRLLPYGPAADVAFNGSAVLVGSHHTVNPAWWKRYGGGTGGKIWLDATGGGEFVRILTEVGGNLVSPMWVAGRIAFLSDHEGAGSLYSCLPDGSDLRRHTDHGPLYARNATTDGTRVVYHCAGDIWILDDLTAPEAAPRKIDINLGGAVTGRQAHPVAARQALGSFRPDRTGRGSVVEVRGTIHWLTHRDGPARTLLAAPGVRARTPDVLGTDAVVWVDDAEGEDALVVAAREGTGEPRRLATGELGRVLELATAPDGRSVAVATHDNRLLLVDVESGEAREVARSSEGEVTGLAFSPDSAWLAWSHPGGDVDPDNCPAALRRIRLARLEDLSVIDVTPLRFSDFSPVFTLDGKHLAFLSRRVFDPRYDDLVFDMTFQASCRPYLVPLAATTPSPFAPELGGRPADPSSGPSGAGSENGEKKNGDAPAAVVVDAEGITERVVPFPVAAGDYDQLLAVKDAVLWLDRPAAGELGDGLASLDDSPAEARLRRYDFVKREESTLLSEVSAVEVTGDGGHIVVWHDDEMRVVPADDKSNGDKESTVTVDLDRVRVTVEPIAEWRQSYAEAWRLMRDNYWRPDMGGLDWDAVRARYEPLIERLTCHDEFVDLLWEVHGELGSSHAYVIPPGGGRPRARRQGLLGADLTRDGDGAWRVARVPRSETSVLRARSPLAAPGVAVRAGDEILAVDGRPVEAATGPNALLAGKAGKPVELTVRPAGGGDVRRVVVVPTDDETPLRYQAWVLDRRAFTHERSGGRLGYLHVPDMVAHGWAEFHRDLRLEMAREGVILDVRGNGGGHTSQLVIEKLARRIVGWDFGRGFSPSPYPYDAPRGPVVAVTDEWAGSDGDIVNQAIRELGIGTIVGTRTWGGVVGIDGKYRLVDGTAVTQPRYAFWFNTVGWSVENYGVDPDIEVPMTPQDWAAGRDPQLEKAIEVALDGLAANPAARPPARPGS